ncbi:epididymal sperm-binding protein 1-like [Platysternon megacephalum]|uniref:Epididymal sperm-binding protein 1-like n=1 Tax=Platysternon megacephalum TaxID=55544 RepID=A0A4D9DU95_9SAUR|nr:epididymal sperm-binding protein 1-like [Platysternon megacephalum]
MAHSALGLSAGMPMRGQCYNGTCSAVERDWNETIKSLYTGQRMAITGCSHTGSASYEHSYESGNPSSRAFQRYLYIKKNPYRDSWLLFLDWTLLTQIGPIVHWCLQAGC